MHRGISGCIIDAGRYARNRSISSHRNLVVVIVDMTYFDMSDICRSVALRSCWRVMGTAVVRNSSDVLDKLPSRTLHYLRLKQQTQEFSSTEIMHRSQHEFSKCSCSSYFECASPLLTVYSNQKNNFGLIV